MVIVQHYDNVIDYLTLHYGTTLRLFTDEDMLVILYCCC